MSSIAVEIAAPLLFTSSAAGKVRRLIEEEDNPNLKLRVFVSGGGCSGFQYGFAFEEAAGPDDTVVEREGVSLLIDPDELSVPDGRRDRLSGKPGRRALRHQEPERHHHLRLRQFVLGLSGARTWRSRSPKTPPPTCTNSSPSAARASACAWACAPAAARALAYTLEFVDDAQPGEERFESHGVLLLIDPKSLAFLDGTELDFVREGLNEGFKFNNPNVKAELRLRRKLHRMSKSERIRSWRCCSIAEPGQSRAPHQHRLAIGIDLGTTNSLVASVRDGSALALEDAHGRSLLPSVVRYLGHGGIDVGHEACAAQTRRSLQHAWPR